MGNTKLKMFSRQLSTALSRKNIALRLGSGTINCGWKNGNNWNSNFISTSSARQVTFTIQDEAQFKTKVMAEDAGPTIVDFWASWCGPCKLLTPRLDAAIAATEGKVNLALVNIDDLSNLAFDYDVQAVPTVLAVKNGKVVDKFIGLIDEDNLGAFVNKLI